MLIPSRVYIYICMGSGPCLLVFGGWICPLSWRLENSDESNIYSPLFRTVSKNHQLSEDESYLWSIRNTRADHAATHMRLANHGGNLQLISSVLEAARPDRSIVDHARISDGKRGRIYMGVSPADRAPVARVRRSTPRLKSLAEICLFLTDRCIHLLRVGSVAVRSSRLLLLERGHVARAGDIACQAVQAIANSRNIQSLGSERGKCSAGPLLETPKLYLGTLYRNGSMNTHPRSIIFARWVVLFLDSVPWRKCRNRYGPFSRIGYRRCTHIWIIQARRPLFWVMKLPVSLWTGSTWCNVWSCLSSFWVRRLEARRHGFRRNLKS
jgi:hypothetical protein